MSREALVLLVCCCDFRDGAERLIPSKSLRNAVIRAFPGLFCILRMCAPRRAAAVVRPRGREKSADRRRRILISRLLIIRASVPRRKSPFPAYFKGFPAVSPLIPPYPAFLKYPVSPQPARCLLAERWLYPVVAQQYETDCLCIERDICSVIDTLWARDPRLLKRLSRSPLPQKPAPAEFVAILASLFCSGGTAA